MTNKVLREQFLAKEITARIVDNVMQETGEIITDLGFAYNASTVLGYMYGNQKYCAVVHLWQDAVTEDGRGAELTEFFEDDNVCWVYTEIISDMINSIPIYRGRWEALIKAHFPLDGE
jgi:hypothetical protein